MICICFTHLVNYFTTNDQLFDLGHTAKIVDDHGDRVSRLQTQPWVPFIQQPVQDLGNCFSCRTELKSAELKTCIKLIMAKLTLVLPIPFSPWTPSPSSISSSASEKLALDPGRLQGVRAIPNVDMLAFAVSSIFRIEGLSLPKHDMAPAICENILSNDMTTSDLICWRIFALKSCHCKAPWRGKDFHKDLSFLFHRRGWRSRHRLWIRSPTMDEELIILYY